LGIDLPVREDHLLCRLTEAGRESHVGAANVDNGQASSYSRDRMEVVGGALGKA
jgi:hypothetical protein